MPASGWQAAPARRLLRALAAGLIGGAVLDGFLLASGLAMYPGAYEYIASAVVGPAAYRGGQFIAMGVALHFAISIFWALLYALVAGQTGQLRRWSAGGAILGVVAWAVMQAVQIYVGLIAHFPTGGTAFAQAAIHVVFYGWPVALWMSRPIPRAGR